MGKLSQQGLPVVQQRRADEAAGGFGCSKIFCCRICSVAVSKDLSFKCVFVVLLSVALFLYALFSVVHLHSKQIGFDADESIKLIATAQAYFRLQKPVKKLIPHISQLEDEIFGEIGAPSLKVVILSMHQAGTSNCTDVVFGVLSDSLNVSIDPTSAYSSLLRSTLIELFLEQANLTLTNMTFGQPSLFEILRFPGGITLIPERSPPFGQAFPILFNFTLNNSVGEIKENFATMMRQLRFFLHLMPDEDVYIQVTNKNGSTRDAPVTVEASIYSDGAILSPQRLREVAQTITGSPAENLGLEYSVFGKVKEVSLSSSLNHSLHVLPPTPSPSPAQTPAPELNDNCGPSRSPSPLSESDPPSPKSSFHHIAPCYDCDASAPSDASHLFAPNPESHSHRSFPPIPYSLAPSVVHNSPKYGPGMAPSSSALSRTYPTGPSSSPSSSGAPPSEGPKLTTSVGPSPLSAKSYSSISASSTSLIPGSFYDIWWICLLGLFILCWTF